LLLLVACAVVIFLIRQYYILAGLFILGSCIGIWRYQKYKRYQRQIKTIYQLLQQSKAKAQPGMTSEIVGIWLWAGAHRLYMVRSESKIPMDKQFLT
jgi:hypothetical protein